jgi:hypothetical protein
MRLKDKCKMNRGKEAGDSKEPSPKNLWNPELFFPAWSLKPSLKECENTSAEQRKCFSVLITI